MSAGIPGSVQALLDEVFAPAAHEQWLNHPQRRFGGYSAQDMLNANHVHEVEALLHSLADGVFA